MKPGRIFTEDDYETGEFNLLKMERKIIIRDLKIAQNIKKASKILNISDRSLHRKLISHQINREEWKKPSKHALKPKKWKVIN